MAKLKFKDENNEFIPVVQDVKVNNLSVFDEKEANINLKTINNQSIVGNGDITIDVQDVVKTTANQGLTTQQKLNARNNISALGTSNIKQGIGTSTTDVISQKGVTDLLAEKQSRVPNGTNPLISIDTGKLDLVYMPATVLGGITNGGTFNSQGIINASSYAPELQGLKIDEVAFASYPSYYFICSDNYSFAGFDFTVGDWAISLGNGWAKLNATDAVTSVNGKMGQVVLNADDIQAVPLFFGGDNANKNLVTDYLGMVTTSDYALGQIIVDYYEELPTNVPLTAKASVVYSSNQPIPYTVQELEDAMQEATELNAIEFSESMIQASESNTYYLSASNNDGDSFNISYGTDVTNEDAYYIDYTFGGGHNELYIYSYSVQEFLGDEQGSYLQIGWNKAVYNESLEYYVITQPSFENIPVIRNAYVSDCNIDSSFASNLNNYVPRLAGEYIYSQEEPVTDPPTYYWKYTPTNVQSDNSEDDPLSLAYIKNRAVLRTNLTTGLRPEAEETIKGTIRLHKISKTGDYSDLRNRVGQVDEVNGGEIFGTYTGQYANKANSSAVAFGSGNESNGSASFTANSYNTASGLSSFAIGHSTTASNVAAFSNGQFTTASGNSSFATGAYNTASGNFSFVCGYFTEANGVGAMAEGFNTKASSDYQHVQGKYNIVDSLSTYAHIVGNGTSASNRSNAHTIDWNGNAWFKGDIRVGGTSWDTGTPIGGGGSTAKKKTLTEASQNYSVSNNVVTVTDNDVTVSTTEVELYPDDIATETWLQNNLNSCIITQSAGSFSFSIKSSLPATFSMYYIITEVE